MSRVAEISVQTPHSSSARPGRGDSRDPAGFSALIDDETAVAADPGGDAIAQAGKTGVSRISESADTKAASPVPSTGPLIALLPMAATDASLDAAVAGVTGPVATSQENDAAAQALAALTFPAGETTDTTADAAEDDNSADDAASAAPASSTVAASAIVTPSVIVSNVVATDADPPQADIAALGGVTVPNDTGLTASVQADAKFAATAEVTPDATASPNSPPATALSAKPGEAQGPKRPATIIRRESATLPTSELADGTTSADAGTKASAEIHGASGTPAPLHHERAPAADAGPQADGLSAEAKRGDAALSDAKPAAAQAVVSSATQSPAQPSDNPALAPAAPLATQAAQPALLQAQLIATPAVADTAVPLDGLAIELAARATSGKSRFEIRLDPPELGRIDVRLDIDRHGRVGTHLVVDKVETLDMLRRDAPQLERALTDSGLKTGDGSLQFSLRDQSFGRNDQNDGRQSARLVISEEDTVPAAVAGRSYRMAGAAGSLDIRV